MMEHIVWFAKTDAPDQSAAVRQLLARALGYMPRLAYGAHGKPFLPEEPERQISLAHTRGAVVCAVSPRPVGVDIESFARRVNMRVAERSFTPRERAYAVDAARFLNVWTRKEAFVKRDGRGFTLPLNTVETCGRTDIATYMEQGYVISVCGQAADFVLRTVTL